MKTSTVVLMILCGIVAPAAEPRTVRATLKSALDRKPAPAFRLLNATGKAMRNTDYRGKIVLLDFWATECRGCKTEIPWFMELESAYKKQGVTVVGVSMDILYENLKDANEAWGRVKPFAESHGVNCQILMGDDPVVKAYDIQAMPATYLIDKRGRVAATYIGIVDKDNVEANIKALLAE